MAKNDEQQQLLDFYIEDFKNTSDKLESTDKKCQFIIQLFVSFATITISVMSILASGTNQIVIDNIWLFITLAFLIIIGQFTYDYNVSGNSHHAQYINRMNTLRILILYTCKADKIILNNYSFIKLIKARSKGMGYGMLMLLNYIIALLFLTASAIFYLTQSGFKYYIHVCLVIIVLMLVLFIRNICFYEEKCKDADAISEDLYHKVNKIVENN